MPSLLPSSSERKDNTSSTYVADKDDLRMRVQGLKIEKRNDSDQTIIHHTASSFNNDERDDSDDDTEYTHDTGDDSHITYDTNVSESNGGWQRELGSQVSGNSETSHVDGASYMSSLVSDNEHAERLIQAAARAVVASIEKDEYEAESSMLSSYTTDGTDRDEAQDRREDGLAREANEIYHSDTSDHYDESGSSNHEDDVFSDHRDSKRSSLNSFSDPHTDEERRYIGHKIRTSNDDQKFARNSREPSEASDAHSLMPEALPLTGSSSPDARTPHTSKVLSRPPFRTPSSIRALQMSSPTPSISLGSPRSLRKVKTPGRFKVKKEYPLILLHVTVLQTQWSYADIMEAPTQGWSQGLLELRQSWRLIQEKMSDIVLERGILLQHPQDDFEILEERLLEALELPVRPRAKILSCGHYLGPESDLDMDLDDPNCDAVVEKWCDICGREVLYEDFGFSTREKRFSVKVYASNGLMRAGAWAAAWREMERVDVEVEPLVEASLAHELAILTEAHEAEMEEKQQREHERSQPHAEDPELRRALDVERMREIYGTSPPPDVAEQMTTPSTPESHLQNVTPTNENQSYGTKATETTKSRSPSTSRKRRPHLHDDSLSSLLWAAIKVTLQDQKNIAICILGFLVLFLAIRSGPGITSAVTSSIEMTEDVIKPIVQAEIVQSAIETGKQGVVRLEEEMLALGEQVIEVPTMISQAAQEVVEKVQEMVVGSEEMVEEDTKES